MSIDSLRSHLYVVHKSRAVNIPRSTHEPAPASALDAPPVEELDGVGEVCEASGLGCRHVEAEDGGKMTYTAGQRGSAKQGRNGERRVLRLACPYGRRDCLTGIVVRAEWATATVSCALMSQVQAYVVVGEAVTDVWPVTVLLRLEHLLLTFCSHPFAWSAFAGACGSDAAPVC